MDAAWRWFGPADTVTLEAALQAGAGSVVTSLHHIPVGDAWPAGEIAARQALIASQDLTWSVVESVPVHDDIKARNGSWARHVANYQQTIRNLGAAGITRICYNFMPVVDWTRTTLDFDLPTRGQALRFDMTDFAAYDIFVLERPGARGSYPDAVVERAATRYTTMHEAERRALENNIIAGLPGGAAAYDRNGLARAIAGFTALGAEELRGNLCAFLEQIIPVAEESGVAMCIHPDDPPLPLFGLPRVVSTAGDARLLLAAVPSPANGLTLCTGSYGARSDNDLVAMVREFGPRIHFAHLRNVRREADGSFYESGHVAGDVDMAGVVAALLDEESRRRRQDSQAGEITMRPDHGHALWIEKGDARVRPGYSFAGRMQGLAELRGVIHVLQARGAQ